MNRIALILHDIRSTYNVGSILRSAECFGITQVYISGYTPYPIIAGDTRLPHEAKKLDSQIAKTALGAEKIVPISLYTSVQNAVNAARLAGYSIAALEQSSASIYITDYDFKDDLALVLGNEVVGVDDWTKQSCDVILEIKQYGNKESLNVASAAAIAMFAARNK